jgi:hypothetical protein
VNIAPHLRDASVVLRRETRRETVGIDVHAVRKCEPKDLAVRFAFGFVVSALIGLIAMGGANRAVGLFLAFPAILPASLTLISRDEGRDKASVDAVGAMIGGLGLSGFGAASFLLLGRTPVVVAELGALAVWLMITLGVYLMVRARLRRSVKRSGRDAMRQLDK